MPSTKRSIEDISSAIQQPERVTFNVGGEHYEVSRSLLDQHKESMLSRMASKTWNENDDKSLLFVERDSTRFAYVLDYMRDGKVTLPLSVPRTAFLQDMEYFGLDYDQEKVGLIILPGLETRLIADEVNRKSHEAKERASKIEEELIDLERKRFCEEVAIKCYRQYAGGRLMPNELYTLEDCCIRLSAMQQARDFLEPLNDVLGPVYGLKCTELCFSAGAVRRLQSHTFKIGHYMLRESEQAAFIKVHVELSALGQSNEDDDGLANGPAETALEQP